MGVFDPNYKRLGIIIFIFLFLTCMYTIEYVAFGVAKDTGLDADIDSEGFNVSSLESAKGDVDTSGGDLLSMIQFITYTTPEIPDYQKVILAPLVTILLVVLAYLIIDIIYDIIKALPLT